MSGNSSPVSSMIPVVVVPPTTMATFLVPASDPDGDGLTWRLSSESEAGGGPHPLGLSVDEFSGLVTWDNTVAVGDQTAFWTTQIVIEDAESKASVDFLLKIQPVVGTLPMCGISPAGPLSTNVGTPVAFSVTGTDGDTDATVTLNSGGLPVGATMSPPLPETGASGVSSAFSWTPTAGQEGTHVVLFSATDNDSQQGLCSITVEVNIIGPAGGDLPVEDDGIVVGSVTIPEGAFNNPVVIKAAIVEEGACLVRISGASDICLQITIPSGTTINSGFFATISLCLPDGSPPPPVFAIFRTSNGETVVLQNVVVESGCAGALTSSFSDFQLGPQLFVEKAEVDDDEIEIRGTFDLAGVPFDPASENVTITFGECAGPGSCVELVLDGADFERDDGDFEFEFENGDLEIEVEIRGDGRYKIDVEGADVGGIDLGFVSFMMQIGTRLQGVGLEFDDDGDCIGANGSPGCGAGDDDDDDDDDDDEDDEGGNSEDDDDDE